MTAPNQSDRPGRLVVISGPSGSGKTSIIERLRAHARVRVSVNVVTRPPREDEVDGRDYTFVSRERFLEMLDKGQFVETNDVFGSGHLYGSVKQDLEDALATEGAVYLMEVDVTGARNIRKAGYDGLYIFIAPPSSEVLEQRLRRRGTDDEAAIARRLGRAREEREMAEADGALIIVNEDLDEAVARIEQAVGLSSSPTAP